MKPANQQDESKTRGDIFDNLLDLFDLDHGVDYQATIAEINEQKSMYGANAWMLICSIIIASIGLNTNSQAVIIGAMLISPLMSPILAIGLGVAINDRKALKDSIKHFAISIVIAIVASTLFFMISPLKEITEQIQARTAPTIFDVAIGIFGGVAGIISIARKDISTTLPGVAIATALMPPLCVTGYGLAINNGAIALSSFYLFFINAFFVAFATYVIIRYMNFPLKEYTSKEERKKNLKYIYLFSFLMILPSLLIFRTVWKEANTEANVNSFIEEYIGKNQIYLDEYEIIPSKDGPQILYLRVWGNEIQNDNAAHFEEGLKKYNLRNTIVEILATSEIPLAKIKELESELNDLSHSAEDINSIRNEIEEQQEILSRMQQLDSTELVQNYDHIASEIKVLFPNVETINIGQTNMTVDDSTRLLLHLTTVEWKKRIKEQGLKDEKIQEFLKLRLGVDTLSYFSATASNK